MVEVRADDGEIFRALERAKGAGDFLLDLGHTDSLFGQVISECARSGVPPLHACAADPIVECR